VIASGVVTVGIIGAVKSGNVFQRGRRKEKGFRNREISLLERRLIA
jgi:hypothetical protein